jgi:hypothetical protein
VSEYKHGTIEVGAAINHALIDKDIATCPEPNILLKTKVTYIDSQDLNNLHVLLANGQSFTIRVLAGRV